MEEMLLFAEMLRRPDVKLYKQITKRSILRLPRQTIVRIGGT
jgi:hypothetical protein